jgi:transformation/transcription domain-associated protein
MIADLLHHLRAQLSSHQLSRVIHIYSCNLHNASLSIQIQNMCMKVLITLVECVIQQCSRPDAAQILGSLLETAIEKLDAVHRMHQDLLLMAEATKGHVDPILGFVAVEKAKPIQGASFVTESPEEVFRGKF